MRVLKLFLKHFQSKGKFFSCFPYIPLRKIYPSVVSALSESLHLMPSRVR